jgi:chemotaxis signal transduction protein
VSSTKRVLKFKVGSKMYAIEINYLKEVSGAAFPTRIPGIMECVSQVIGFRGHPIPVLDLRMLVKPLAPKLGVPKQIILNLSSFFCALWVDEISEICRAKGMDKSTSLMKKDYGGPITALVGDVLWGSGQGIAVLDPKKIEHLLSLIEKRTEKLSITSEERLFEKSLGSESDVA